mmetsp:Transcript_8919/g.20850  ORF Transcript_8919/g.20850 Transcript_8919/m.20850 type:complete len:365 (+) Transcript_8919:61-1155(+)
MGGNNDGGIDPATGGLAFGLTCAAGMCTTIGAAVVFNEKLAAYANKRFLAASLGVSAGVMLYVSFIEIFFKSQGSFQDAGFLEGTAHALAALCFFSGIAVGNLLDYVVHWLEGKDGAASEGAELFADAEGTTEKGQCCKSHDTESMFDAIDGIKAKHQAVATNEEVAEAGGAPKDASSAITVSASGSPNSSDLSGKEGALPMEVGAKDDDRQKALVKMGMMTALAIGLHNFPEGLATFVGTLDDPTVGMGLAVAIGIHNIPEGLCVSIPIYYATKNRWQAFKWAFISGISEPIGAALGWIFLANCMSDSAYAVIFGLVSGMMVNICIHELIPTAVKYDPEDKVTSKSVIAGMLVMALSLVLFAI